MKTKTKQIAEDISSIFSDTILGEIDNKKLKKTIKKASKKMAKRVVKIKKKEVKENKKSIKKDEKAAKKLAEKAAKTIAPRAAKPTPITLNEKPIAPPKATPLNPTIE